MTALLASTPPNSPQVMESAQRRWEGMSQDAAAELLGLLSVSKKDWNGISLADTYQGSDSASRRPEDEDESVMMLPM